jgi:hypothetical protein
MLLYSRRGIRAARICPERFSNGDANTVQLQLHNAYRFAVDTRIIDELPYQFQSGAGSGLSNCSPVRRTASAIRCGLCRVVNIISVLSTCWPARHWIL